MKAMKKLLGKKSKPKKDESQKSLLKPSKKSKHQELISSSQTSAPVTKQRIQTQQISEFDIVWNLFTDAVKNIEQNPFEVLCATVVLRFALEKELAREQQKQKPEKNAVVTSDDIRNFLKNLKAGALELDLTKTQAMSTLNLRLNKFGQRDSLHINDVVGTANAFLPQVVETLAPKIGLSDSQESQPSDETPEENPEVWRKFRVYVYKFQSLLQQGKNYITAHSEAVVTANSFYAYYTPLVEGGMNEIDATYLAEAFILQLKDKSRDEYLKARKEHALSLEASVEYAQAVEKSEVKYPVLYALFKVRGKTHDEAIHHSNLLGENNIGQLGFQSYIRNMETEHSSQYCVAYAIAFEHKYRHPSKYAELIESGKSEIYAKAFVDMYSSKLEKNNEPVAQQYAALIEAGKTQTYATTFLAAITKGFAPHEADIYAETYEKNNSQPLASFNSNPTFSKWFNLNRSRNIAISCTGVGFLVLACIAYSKINQQNQLIEERRQQYEIQNPVTKTVQSKKPVTTTTESSDSKEFALEDWKKSSEQTGKNEQDWNALRQDKRPEVSNNNNNIEVQTKPVL